MKKLALILLAALLCFSLVACSPEEDGGNELDNYTPPATTAKIDTGTLTFEEGPAETAIITKYSGLSEKHEVEIPEVVNDRPVSAIGKEAFYYQTLITKITLPDTVEYIDDFAFAGCTELTTIVIPASVTRIGKYAFQGCTKLESVIFAGTELEVIDSFAFNDCTALSEITLPEGLVTIGDQSFGDCAAIASLTMPSTLKTIGNLTFVGCTALNAEGALTLSASITEIGEFAFQGIDKNYIVCPEGSYAEEYVNDMFETVQ
ncbi:MAG: leucine-rich repeat domain-containing protein [Clostridia bacterium]|nr:leucine-rich repeat domain-containing protein [Clostridia bacterium]